MLDLSALRRITSEDQLAIVSMLESPDLAVAEKGPLIWGAAFAGGSESTSALINLIENNSAYDIEENDDMDVIFDALLVLGLFADEEEQAFDYLTMHLRPEMWSDEFDMEACSDNAIESLTSFTIQGIGASGHPAVDELLQDLGNRSSAFSHRYAGDIVQAYFYQHIREMHDPDGLMTYLVTEDNDHRLFLKWSENEGYDLVAWANDSMRGPRPDGCARYAVD